MLQASSNPVIPPPVQSSFGQVPEFDPHIHVLQTIPCTSLHFVHYTCGVDTWTWGSWAYGIYVSVLHILLCYTDISVLYSDDNFFDTTDTASPSTVVLSACHTAHFYMV